MPDNLSKRGSPDNKRISQQAWEQAYQKRKAAKRPKKPIKKK